jgi:O-antigen/teichoic acid export membrane protein
MALIGLRMPFLASFLLFVRSALWVFPFAALGLFFPQCRHIDLLFDFWIGALAVSYICLFWQLRDWPWKAIASAAIHWKWMFANLKKARLIYVSDLGLAGLAYADRFVIGSLLGLEALGVYVFYWQIANAVQVLAETAVVQVALPRLFAAHRHEGEHAWRKAFFHEIEKVVIMGVALSLGIYVFVVFVLPYLKLKDLHEGAYLFPAILVGAVLRLLAGIANIGLVSRGLDKIWALTNIAGILLTIACSAVGTYLFELNGVAVAAILSASCLATSKFFFALKDHKQRSRNS